MPDNTNLPEWFKAGMAADPAEAVDNRCRFCGQPVRWSTAYDEPHWVHVNLVDIVRCPGHD